MHDTEVCRMSICLFIADLWSPEGKWLTSWLLFMLFIVFVTFPFGILGQVWYSIPDPCCLSYFVILSLQ